MTEEKQELIYRMNKIIDIQRQDGRWNHDPYMLGLTNGMIIMLSVLTELEPEFINPPNKWIIEKGD